MSWFNGLAPRERFLVGIAAMLTVLFILWQFLISPVFSAIEKSERNLAAAKRDYMIVSAGLPQMKQQNSRGSQAAFNRNAVIETARAANVSISRMQPSSDDSLQVWLDDSPALNVYSFLTELDRRYNASTTKAQLTRRDDGTIAAQFTFEPR